MTNLEHGLRRVLCVQPRQVLTCRGCFHCGAGLIQKPQLTQETMR